LFEFSENTPLIRVETGQKARGPANPGFKAGCYGPDCAANHCRGDLRTGDMRLLLRLGFWLTVILVLLPTGGSQPTPKVNMSAVDAMSAAKATVTDMRSFCERQPEACTVGSQAAVAIGHRAQAGAKMLYEYLNEQLGPHDADAPVSTATGKPVPMPAARPSQHTLSPADLAPPWRGPAPRKEARSNRPT
jgi:uncharacterized protein DUF5330